jgi:hypothetical protein
MEWAPSLGARRSKGGFTRRDLFATSAKQQEPDADESDYHNREAPISRIVHTMAALSRLSPRRQCHGAEGRACFQLGWIGRQRQRQTIEALATRVRGLSTNHVADRVKDQKKIARAFYLA